MCVWNDRSVQWEDFELTVIRSTWTTRATARGISLGSRHRATIQPVSDHRVFDGQALSARPREPRHRIVPTSFCDVGAEPVFPDSRFVVKPTVGAGSIDAEKYGHGEHQRARAHVRRLHASGRDAMIQPYVSSIDESGERALVFIDGDFSHAMTKGAMLNTDADDRDALFRREQMSLATAEPDAVAFAEVVLDEGAFRGSSTRGSTL